MTNEQYLKNLTTPVGPVDVVLDSDAFNEIDDQFAIAYLLACGEKLRIKGFCAAPFYNAHSDSPADGMERSYHEIIKVLKDAHDKAEKMLSENIDALHKISEFLIK